MATIQIKVSEAEAGRIRMEASGAGITVSKWGRGQLLRGMVPHPSTPCLLPAATTPPTSVQAPLPPPPSQAPTPELPYPEPPPTPAPPPPAPSREPVLYARYSSYVVEKPQPDSYAPAYTPEPKPKSGLAWAKDFAQEQLGGQAYAAPFIEDVPRCNICTDPVSGCDTSVYPCKCPCHEG
jgi:hypothetical protein